jgi:hypothetical protein
VSRSQSSTDRLWCVGALIALSAAALHNWRAWRDAGRHHGGSHDDGSPAPGHSAIRPSISVLVAAWNEAPLIEPHLASFRTLSHPNVQMVICAGGPDGTFELANSFAGPNVIVLRQYAGEGKQAALRRCLAAATGEILVFTDADCIMADKPLELLVDPLTQGAVVTTGFDEPLPEQRGDPFILSQWLSASGSRPRTRRRTSSVLGRNCAVHRQALQSSSALEAPARTGTDYVLGHTLAEAGHPILLVPDSLVLTEYPADPHTYIGARRRWVKNLLVHGPRFGAWRDVSSTYFAVAIAATILLGLPLAPIVGPRVLPIWLTAAGITTMNRLRRLAVGGRFADVNLSWQIVATVPMFIMLDQISVLLAALDAVSDDGRSRW